MYIKITKTQQIKAEIPIIYLAKSDTDLNQDLFSANQFEYIKNQYKENKNVVINNFPGWIYINWITENKEEHIIKEKLRRGAGSLYPTINENKHQKIIISDLSSNPEYMLAFAEGMALSHYQFLNYFSNSNKKKESFSTNKYTQHSGNR